MMKNNIYVCLTPSYFDCYNNQDAIVVVVDLLRATTVISTAFAYGVKEVKPVISLEDALKYKNKEGYIVAAERNTLIVKGFNFGNSPYHYYKNKNILGKKLVITTTNGTKAINISKDNLVITSSYINIIATANFLLESDKDVIILCSGWKNMYNMEDALFSASLANILLESNKFKTNCDALFSSQILLKSSNSDLYNFLDKSAYRKRNNSNNLLKDTKFCLNPPISSNVIPTLKNDVLVPHI
tara:strand:+ start:561 stop:1286 length:726 start_codon:yes stop_codon:yes gene_type:complete